MRSAIETSRPSVCGSRAALVRTKNACSASRARERAVLLQPRHEDPHLPLEVVRELVGPLRCKHPARLGLDRAQDMRREAARAQVLPQGVERGCAREAHVALQRRDAGLQANERVDSHALQGRGLLLPDLDRAVRARPSASCRRAACDARRRPGRSARACRRRRRRPVCRPRSGRDRRAAARAGNTSPRGGSRGPRRAAQARPSRRSSRPTADPRRAARAAARSSASPRGSSCCPGRVPAATARRRDRCARSDRARTSPCLRRSSR